MAILYYKDFETGKLRYTFAKPVKVTRDGPLNEEGLFLQNRRGVVWIPRYLLVGASVAVFNSLKAQQEQEKK